MLHTTFALTCIAQGGKNTSLLHLVWAIITSWVYSIAGCLFCYYVSPFSYSFPAILFCQSRVGFNEWTSLLVGAACLQLWMKLSGVFGMVPDCPSSASVSNRRRRRRCRRWRPAHWMCLMWTDGQQTACHVCRKTRVLFLIYLGRSSWRLNAGGER